MSFFNEYILPIIIFIPIVWFIGIPISDWLDSTIKRFPFSDDDKTHNELLSCQMTLKNVSTYRHLFLYIESFFTCFYIQKLLCFYIQTFLFAGLRIWMFLYLEIFEEASSANKAACQSGLHGILKEKRHNRTSVFMYLIVP